MNSNSKALTIFYLPDILDVMELHNYQSFENGDLVHSAEFKHLRKLAELKPFIRIEEEIAPIQDARVKDWDTFLAECTEVFVQKNTDYDSRFMKALIEYRRSRGGLEAARVIWAWEVEKKLDRCRTWIQRGELQVKDEGVRNSVVDLFNYSVQFLIFNYCIGKGIDPLKELSERSFFETAAKYSPPDWVNFLAHNRLLDLGNTVDNQVATLLIHEMTGFTASE